MTFLSERSRVRIPAAANFFPSKKILNRAQRVSLEKTKIGSKNNFDFEIVTSFTPSKRLKGSTYNMVVVMVITTIYDLGSTLRLEQGQIALKVKISILKL